MVEICSWRQSSFKASSACARRSLHSLSIMPEVIPANQVDDGTSDGNRRQMSSGLDDMLILSDSVEGVEVDVEKSDEGLDTCTEAAL